MKAFYDQLYYYSSISDPIIFNYWKFKVSHFTYYHLPGNTLLTRRVLPESEVMANMTGHAMWQTFVNKTSEKDSESIGQTAGDKDESYKGMLKVQWKWYWDSVLLTNIN